MTITAIDHIHHGHIGAAYMSEESAFCTIGTERRCWPVADSLEITPKQMLVDARGLSVKVFDAKTPLAGDKSVSVKWGYYLQPPATLNSSAATPDTSATNPLRIPLKTVFGGESVAAGSDIDTASSGTSFSVTAGHGARFPIGQLYAVDTDVTYGFEVVQSRSRSTDALTCYPALSATPAGGQDITNLNTYYVTNSNALSMSLAVSTLNNARQIRAKGLNGSVQLKFEKNALAVADFAMEGATFDGPDSLSYAITRSEDTMANPLSVRNALMYLQAVATTTRVNTPVDSVTITLNFGNMHLTSLTGTTEGKRGVHRGENLIDSCCKVELLMPDNADVYTWYAAQSELSFWFIVKVDPSAGGRRFVVVHCPQVIVESYPEVVKGEGNLTKLKVTLRAKVSEQCTGTATELSESPVVLGLG